MLRPGRGNNAGGGGLPSYGGSGAGLPGGDAYTPYGGGYSSNSFKDKPHQRNGAGPLQILKQPLVLLSMATLILLVSTMNYRGQRNSILRELHVKSTNEAIQALQALEKETRKAKQELRFKQKEGKETSQEYDALVIENRQLQKERDELLVKYESPEKSDEIARMKHREDAWISQVQLLQQAAARESRRAAVEKFGSGPHHVKMGLILPDDESEKVRYFTLEMAPLQSMPHAVHLFLEQVYHGLWDDAWIYLNGPHVLQIGPESSEDEDGSRYHALKDFREQQLDELAFPEYSEDFPHLPWTIGFTGRPGGPDFYINKQDNVRRHGPGGQRKYDLDEFGDPCFGKVIDGFDLLREIYELPVEESGDYKYYFEEPIHIVQARILEPMPKPLHILEPGHVGDSDLQNKNMEEDPIESHTVEDVQKNGFLGVNDTSPREAPSGIPEEKNETITEAEHEVVKTESRRKPKKELKKPKIEHQVDP